MGRPPTSDDLTYLDIRRFGRLATADLTGRPSVVPFCFALLEQSGSSVMVSALDEKPKSIDVRSLRRVRNIIENPIVSVVVDNEDEDWSQLTFVQVIGRARLVEPSEPGFILAIAALRMKYPQYESMAIERNPVIWIEELEAVSWRGGEAAAHVRRSSHLMNTVSGRRSVRVLRPDPVPRALIVEAVKAAGWAPSPHGRQPWRFSVVESIERKTRLADDMASSWQSQLEMDGQDSAVVTIRLAKSRERIIKAPLIIVPCLYVKDLDEYPDLERQRAEVSMAVQSLGAAIQNFMLTIYASGLDSGWMCAPLFCPEVVRDSLELSLDFIPQALLPVGYAAKDPVRRPRLPPEELIVDWR